MADTDPEKLKKKTKNVCQDFQCARPGLNPRLLKYAQLGVEHVGEYFRLCGDFAPTLRFVRFNPATRSCSSANARHLPRAASTFHRGGPVLHE